jgi:glycosyltransferase involved in cell wall biosynthesis
MLVNTQDERDIHHTGVFDLRNVGLGLLHSARFALRAARNPVDLVYIPVAQNRWGYARDAVLLAIGRVLRRPLVVHLHGAELQTRLAESNRLERSVIRETLRWVAMGIVLTPGLVDQFAGLIPRSRVRVLENGIVDPWPQGVEDIERERMDRAAANPAAIRMLFVSNLLVKKGGLTLVRALAEPGLRQATLRIVGGPSPEDMEAVVGLATELGVEHRLELVGSRTGVEKLAEFRRADVMVHPTESDGQPLVLIEGLAAGLPLIGSTFGGVPETIGDCGTVIEAGDPAAIASAVRALIDDPDLRGALGRKGRRRYLDRYSPASYQRRFSRVFSELLSER